uniref:Uncharacterized protein n=1 Tax=Pristionchus pacificus TaxID=54126 RepID=A0A2A6BJG4_PRIPA|eukprot:PDM66042.1 hypothetical protein PRIPAC_45267 [Pristionchus pacificus]
MRERDEKGSGHAPETPREYRGRRKAEEDEEISHIRYCYDPASPCKLSLSQSGTMPVMRMVDWKCVESG